VLAQRSRLPAPLALALTKTDWHSVERDLRWVEQPACHLLLRNDPHYPILLGTLPDAPPLLFVRGQVERLSDWQLAVVGSRNPTPQGERNAYDFAQALSQSGLTLTSGLALGIDGAVHRGALAAGGHTLAVMGTGLDRVYPARHVELATLIVAQGGALVSEFLPNTPPRPAHFPQRNRIISGLSLGLLVVEASLESGSLITARLAAEQGREVFALPGSIHNPMARGCHALIRQGAKLVETLTDILEELPSLAQAAARIPLPISRHQPETPSLEPPGDATEAALLALLGADPLAFDHLVERSGHPPEVLSAALLMLELQGHVASLPGGNYTRLS
jgi:DNA processing protein